MRGSHPASALAESSGQLDVQCAEDAAGALIAKIKPRAPAGTRMTEMRDHVDTER